jgi:site-specific recombinase XerD
MRKRVATFGKRGHLVRVMEVQDAKGRRFVVQWGPSTARAQQSFPGKQGKAEAMAFAEAFALEIGRPKAAEPTAPITTRELWQAYTVATFPHLRPRTKVLYKEFWSRWENFYGADRAAGDMTHDDCDRFRADLERVGLASATIQKTIVCVRGVYNYAERTEKIAKNRWHAFRFSIAKERRTKPRAEYRQHEFLAIWRQFDPAKAWHWRPYVAIGLLGTYGMRQNALLHLKWEDVTDEAITLVSEWDKQGETQVLPMNDHARQLLAVAGHWREQAGYDGPWVFFTARPTRNSPIYTIQSLWDALKEAEKRAHIEPIKFRAGHGFRRGLVGDLLESGVAIDLALQAIGDKDLRMHKHYAIKRDERVTESINTRAQLLQSEGVAATAATKTATNLQPAGPSMSTVGRRTNTKSRSDKGLA